MGEVRKRIAHSAIFFYKVYIRLFGKNRFRVMIDKRSRYEIYRTALCQ